MLKNKTKNNHADPYHPSDLFNLNGEGITWEETKQGEQDKKQHFLAKVLVCLLIFATDIIFYLNPEAILHSLGAFGVPAIIFFVGPIFLSVLSLWAFMTLIWLCAYLNVIAITWYRKSLRDDDTSTDSSEDNVLNYVRDNSRILKEYRIKTHLNFYEAKIRRDGPGTCSIDRAVTEIEAALPDPVGRLSSHVIAQKPIYLPVGLYHENLYHKKLTVYVIHSEDFPYKNTLRGCKFGESSTMFVTSVRELALDSAENIDEYFEALPDLFAKEEMRDALTAYIYAEHQYYEVENTARRVLPEWTDDDSVLLEDYSALQRWYANYRETCMNRIISLIEDYARELDFKNDQKKTRSEAISRALTA